MCETPGNLRGLIAGQGSRGEANKTWTCRTWIILQAYVFNGRRRVAKSLGQKIQLFQFWIWQKTNQKIPIVTEAQKNMQEADAAQFYKHREPLRAPGAQTAEQRDHVHQKESAGSGTLARCWYLRTGITGFQGMLPMSAGGGVMGAGSCRASS